MRQITWQYQDYKYESLDCIITRRFLHDMSDEMILKQKWVLEFKHIINCPKFIHSNLDDLIDIANNFSEMALLGANYLEHVINNLNKDIEVNCSI